MADNASNTTPRYYSRVHRRSDPIEFWCYLFRIQCKSQSNTEYSGLMRTAPPYLRSLCSFSRCLNMRRYLRSELRQCSGGLCASKVCRLGGRIIPMFLRDVEKINRIKALMLYVAHPHTCCLLEDVHVTAVVEIGDQASNNNYCTRGLSLRLGVRKIKQT